MSRKPMPFDKLPLNIDYVITDECGDLVGYFARGYEIQMLADAYADVFDDIAGYRVWCRYRNPPSAPLTNFITKD